MKKGEKQDNKLFEKIDKITKIMVIIVSVILASIFLGACVYMLNLINDTQNTPDTSSNSNVPQNMNLVNM